MVWVLVVLVAVATGAALGFAIKLGKPADAHGSSCDDVDRLTLWSNVDTVRRELRRSIEVKAETVSGRLRETVEDYKDALALSGARKAEETVQVLRQRAEKYFGDTWFWQRVKFDMKAYVDDQILPPLIERYDAFRVEAARDLRARLESVLGTSVESVLESGGTAVGADESDGGGIGLAVGAGAGGAIAAAGYFGGAIVAAPAAAIGAAVLAGWAWKNYKSKEELQHAAMEQAERMARRLFHGDGYRDPTDGSVIPSASAWLEKAANELEIRLTRRIERARDDQLRGIDERYHSLEMKWRSSELDVARLRDSDFIISALYPPTREVARA